MDIEKLDITGLKALAYDILATLEANQRNLDTVNQKIQRKAKEPKAKPKKPKDK